MLTSSGTSKTRLSPSAVRCWRSIVSLSSGWCSALHRRLPTRISKTGRPSRVAKQMFSAKTSLPLGLWNLVTMTANKRTLSMMPCMHCTMPRTKAAWLAGYTVPKPMVTKLHAANRQGSPMGSSSKVVSISSTPGNPARAALAAMKAVSSTRKAANVKDQGASSV